LLLSFQIYHRQIFKLLLSNKVLDEPRQRQLFKPTDLVELFNLNEPIAGEFSESDRLFRESKLTSSGFSLSKIEQMKKLASILSKKISASVKSMRDENEDANNSTCKEKCDEQNDNSRRIDALATKNDMLVDQYLSSDQNNTQKSPSKCEDFDMNSDANIERNSNIENENTFKDNCEQNVITVSSLDNSSVKQKNKIVLSDDKLTSSSTRKRKKHKKKSNSTNVSAMFEGERVSYLIGRRLGRSIERKEPVSITDDDYVLRKLFAKSSKSIHISHLTKYLIFISLTYTIFNSIYLCISKY